MKKALVLPLIVVALFVSLIPTASGGHAYGGIPTGWTCWGYPIGYRVSYDAGHDLVCMPYNWAHYWLLFNK